MDLDDFRSILDTAGVDVWTFIDTAIQVANLDYGPELKEKRDKIVERLFASSRCRNCDSDEKPNGFRAESDVKRESKGGGGGRSPSTPQSVNGDDELDPFAGLFDDEQKSIFEIKELLEDPNQSEESIVDLLQNLADMDINFQALQETDIGRHVNKLRKHSSNEVKRLVKHLVRKWKEIVDDWVRVNNAGYTEAPTLMGDGDSPLQKFPQNGHHQVPDFAYSPNPHNGSSGSDKNHSEPERKLKSIPPPRKELPPKPARSTPPPAPQNVQRQREPKEMASLDSDRFASARKRLQENYKEAENAKKQRTIQVMDIHQLPKPKAKNVFFAKHKPGGSQGRHW